MMKKFTILMAMLIPLFLWSQNHESKSNLKNDKVVLTENLTVGGDFTQNAQLSNPLLLLENFDYPIGSLLTDNGWINHSGTADFIDVTDGLSFSGYIGSGIGGAANLDGSGEDVHKSFEPQVAGNVYAAFVVKTGNTTSAGYFFHFAVDIDPWPNTYYSRVWINATGDGVGIGGSAPDPYVPITAGEPTLLVVKFNMETKVSSLYVFNSFPTEEPTAPNASYTETSTAIVNTGAIGLRQYTPAGLHIIVDGIRIATTWDEAVKGEEISANVVMNEIYSRGTADDPDWIEIYNESNSDVDLSGYKIYDSGGQAGTKPKKEFPAGTIIPSHGFYVIVTDDGTASAFGLSSGGEEVWFENATGTVIDNVIFPAMDVTQSYGRNPDGSANWGLLETITRGTSNNPTVQAPVIAVTPESITQAIAVGGTSTQMVTVSNTGNATLEFGVSASETWFSATPLTGVVEAGQTLDIEVSFTTTGLEVGNYNGSLTFTSNDLVTPTLVVPVSLTILVGLEENPMAAIAVYPVPAINQVNINLVEGVTSIRMFNSHSQVVLESIVNDELIKTLDLEGLRSGIYTLQFINAQGKTFNKSIIINR